MGQSEGGGLQWRPATSVARGVGRALPEAGAPPGAHSSVPRRRGPPRNNIAHPGGVTRIVHRSRFRRTLLTNRRCPTRCRPIRGSSPQQRTRITRSRTQARCSSYRPDYRASARLGSLAPRPDRSPELPTAGTGIAGQLRRQRNDNRRPNKAKARQWGADTERRRRVSEAGGVERRRSGGGRTNGTSDLAEALQLPLAAANTCSTSTKPGANSPSHANAYQFLTSSRLARTRICATSVRSSPATVPACPRPAATERLALNPLPPSHAPGRPALLPQSQPIRFRPHDWQPSRQTDAYDRTHDADRGLGSQPSPDNRPQFSDPA